MHVIDNTAAPALAVTPLIGEALRRAQPARVLEIGPGAGLWPAVLRSVSHEHEPHVELIAPPGPGVPAHRAYDAVHTGDASALLAALAGPWDCVLIDGPLEAIPPAAGAALCRAALAKSGYVIALAPWGISERPAETNGTTPHASNGANGLHHAWTPTLLAGLPVLRQIAYESAAAPRVALILGKEDPRLLRRLNVPPIEHDLPVVRTLGDDLDRVLDRISEQSFALRSIRGHALHRAATRVSRTGAWNAVRWAATRNRGIVRVEVLSGEARILAARANSGEPGVPWDVAEHGAEWREIRDDRAAHGVALTASRGSIRFALDADPCVSVAGPARLRVTRAGRSESIDVPAHATHIYPARESWLGRAPARNHAASSITLDVPAAPTPEVVGPPARPAEFLPEHAAFIEQMRSSTSRAVAIHCPRWLGITSSTRALFPVTYPVPMHEGVDPLRYTTQQVDYHAHVLAEAGVEHIVFSGGDEMHFHLLLRLRELRPQVRADMLWHACYLQFKEDYNWRILRLWMDAARAGLVSSIGVVKAGMDEFFRSLGIPSKLVMNMVPGDVMQPPTDEELGAGTHLGMWLSSIGYRKIPHAMLAAVAMTPDAVLHAAGLDARCNEVIDALAIRCAVREPRPVPHDELLGHIRRTHVSMYVTFAECCPMLPLESMQLGVPCLLGPASHLFEDAPFLFERLVVPFPDRAEVIARMARRAADEREGIIDAYRAYAATYNERAAESVRAFLA
ncbi:MAG: hypothetical protein RBS39_02255 [Phycisphaerales bacterium]|jgi:hypothetical protein|nr:hypothetical protein [Phycisphaerales bacterium]